MKNKEIEIAAKHPYLGINSTCSKFEISKPTLYRMWKEGLIPPPYRIGRTWKWKESELDTFVAEGRAAA